MFSEPRNNNSHYSGSWNPDQNGGHPQPNVGGGHGHGPGPMGLPTVIDSDLSMYIVGGLVAYSIYNKYFKKRDFDGDGKKEGCPVNNEPLCFN